MTRITIVSKIRFFAVAAPIILLAAAAYVSGGLYLLGGAIDRLHERELAAMRAAHEMQDALYEMQWARSQPDGQQILIDQRRAFAHWLGFSQDLAESDDQRRILTAIAQQTDPVFELLRKAPPGDEEAERKARDLHARISDLVSADDSLILELGAASRREARTLIAITLVCGIAIPWLAFFAILWLGNRLSAGLRSIRQNFDAVTARQARATVPEGSEFPAIDDTLARLGFPKPNPMLAE
jgi:hypothetical protein